MGLYVSKPGIDVMTAGKFQMSWSTLYEQFQIVSSGSFILDGDQAPSVFSWPDLGYFPIIFLTNDRHEMIFQPLTTSSAQVTTFQGDFVSSGNADVPCYYIVTRTPMP